MKGQVFVALSAQGAVISLHKTIPNSQRKDALLSKATVITMMKKTNDDSPLLLKRTYDMTTGCYRCGQSEPLMEVHLCGGGEDRLLPLLIKVGVATAVVGTVCAAGAWYKRMRLKKQYRRKLEKKWEKTCSVCRDGRISEAEPSVSRA